MNWHISHVHVLQRPQETFAKEKARLNKPLRRLGQTHANRWIRCSVFVLQSVSCSAGLLTEALEVTMVGVQCKEEKLSVSLGLFSSFYEEGSSSRYCRIHADSFSSSHCSQAHNCFLLFFFFLFFLVCLTTLCSRGSIATTNRTPIGSSKCRSISQLPFEPLWGKHPWRQHHE